MEISKDQATYLALNQQGLIAPTNNAIAIINQIGYVQIDTISVTERSHNHVIHTRNSKFKQEELNTLMLNKELFEYWSHAAAYLPIKDFRFSLYRKEKYKAGNKHWFPRDEKVDKYVLDRIKAEGPLQSKDFENPRDKNHEWYQWKPAKIALTNLFMDGTIMISHRQGFQKVFDLTENILPENINASTPTIEEYCNHLILNTINYFGVANLEEICYLRKGVKPTLKKCIANLIENKTIIPVKIEGVDKPYYSTETLISTLNTIKKLNELHILNPFDNIIIQRKRVKELFDFDYQIECYVPEKKRVYGYYVLPILYQNRFIGRFDAKADRKSKTFIIKKIWLENYTPTDEFYTLFAYKLNKFVHFCGCEKIELLKTTPSNIKKALKSFL